VQSCASCLLPDQLKRLSRPEQGMMSRKEYATQVERIDGRPLDLPIFRRLQHSNRPQTELHA
jgi:hypothetical protein